MLRKKITTYKKITIRISYIHNDVQSPKWNDAGIHNTSFQKDIGGP